MTTLTVTQAGRTNVSGNRLTVSLSAIVKNADGTADTTWDAGGAPFDATAYVANPDMVHIESSAGYVFEYDRVAKKIKAYVQTDPADGGGANVALIEATGLDLTTVTIRIMITGGRA